MSSIPRGNARPAEDELLRRNLERQSAHQLSEMIATIAVILTPYRDNVRTTFAGRRWESATSEYVSIGWLVVLTGTQSHTRDAIMSLVPCTARAANAGARPVPARRLQVRLADPEVAQLVAEYQAGARTTDLAKQFGVHRSTVRRVLRRARTAR